jgi:hypothetical protein
MSFQWSYYAAVMASATRLANPSGCAAPGPGAAGSPRTTAPGAPACGTREFGGYVCVRASGSEGRPGMVDAAIERKVVALVGGGAKVGLDPVASLLLRSTAQPLYTRFPVIFSNHFC